MRVGYASADFHDHAVAHLTAGLFERHDRDRFEIHGYSFGHDDGSDCRRRIAAACTSFVDLGAITFRAAAERIAADGIDVLVDFMSHTGRSRPEVFALRPAAVQAAWLGYAGTTGAGFVDYLVADRVVVPESDLALCAEQVVWLPHCYLATDDTQAIAERAPTRAECGLPERGVVFCAFNQVAKIDAVIFATRVASKAEHLARHRAADLFLDTHLYNAHTTACDALWAGLPVLTCPAASFQGRVATSLLDAVGLAELSVATLADYERTAIELARAPERRAGLKARLERNRRALPLFDTARFARGIERAFETMAARHDGGAPPARFQVE